MTSAARTNKSRGFTLIEMVMVLALAAVLMGGALGIMFTSKDERTLKNTTGGIELLAKRARTISILHQTPYALEFSQGMVRILPFAQTGANGGQAPQGSAVAADEGTSLKNRQFVFDEGVSVEIRRWNSEKWLTTAKDTVHVWRFDPDGLCEPISVRVHYGNSYMGDTFHPLTGSAIPAEKEFELR